MTESRQRGGWPILLSLALAMLLTIVPMPDQLAELRPQWVVLVLIFWCLTAPERIGVLRAFGIGLLLDVMTATLLGQHALGFSIVAYVTVELHRRIRLFPLWQQTLFVWVLLLCERLLTLWVLAATGQPMPTLLYWLPTFLGLLLWPGLAFLLNALWRRAA